MGRPRKNETVRQSNYNLDGRKECIVELEEKFGVKNVMIFCYMSAEKCLYKADDKDSDHVERDIANAEWYFDYVDNLAEKWQTDAFDVRMRQQLEKSIEEAKRKFRQMRREESSEADNGK